MPEETIVLSLPQMVDLALKGPEVGNVNFNILHSLLHVLVKQVNLVEYKVQFKGNDCKRVRNLVAATFTNGTPNFEQQEAPEAYEQELQVIEDDDAKQIIEFEGIGAPSRKELHSLLQEIEIIKGNVAELLDLPKNSTLINALKNSNQLPTPLQDMYRILNLSKRLDALEETMTKFAQLMEEITNNSMVAKSLNERVQVLEDKANDEYEFRFNELEAKFLEYKDFMSTVDNSFNFQVNTLQEHLCELEKEIGEIVEKINACCPGGDTGGLQRGNQELYNKILVMQEEIEKLTTKATQLMEENDSRQRHMDSLLEQIELLKKDKAGREDLEDALANKADICAVVRKVSHDQFDAACDDLSRNIEETLKKLLEQERLWQQALADIQEEIGNKLDKVELSSLQDFVQNKLKMLQERLKALAALKIDTEAAGVKSKYLRKVNCISCDKDVVIRKETDPSLMPPAPSLPPTKSMGPYLTYELDQLRKEQKTPHGRNMRHFEDAVNSKQLDTNHLCNRYCGGSHTTTTPQQRVARVGHFLLQWNAEKQNSVLNQVERESQQSVTQEKKVHMAVSGDILASRKTRTKLYAAKRASQKM